MPFVLAPPRGRCCNGGTHGNTGAVAVVGSRHSGCTPPQPVANRQRRFTVVKGLATVSITLMCVGCGSTSPSAPSATSSPSIHYPVLAVGHWPGTGRLGLQYRDGTGASGWRCQAGLDMVSQTGGTFAGDFALNGTGSSEPPCVSSFEFTATMWPDGTIADFRMNGFGVGSCTPVSNPTVSGIVTNTDVELTISDRAMCRDLFGLVRDFERVRDTDRALTISVHRLPPNGSS